MNHSNVFPRSVENVISVLIGITLTLQNALDILTVLILPMHEHRFLCICVTENPAGLVPEG